MSRNNTHIVQEWRNFYFIFNYPVFILENKLEPIVKDSCRIPFFFEIFVCPFQASGDVSSGFQSQSGQPYSNFAEAYVIYVP